MEVKIIKDIDIETHIRIAKENKKFRLEYNGDMQYFRTLKSLLADLSQKLLNDSYLLADEIIEEVSRDYRTKDIFITPPAVLH